MIKRGQVHTPYIAGVIFGIATLIILLIFISRVYFDDTAQKEVCHLSVLGRASSPESVQSYMPLKCTTQKICLHEDKSKCAFSFAGEKIYEIKLDSDIAKAADQVEEASAIAMYDCWQMMGEGKVDLFKTTSSKYGLKPEKPICVICSRIAVDANESKREAIFEEMDLGEYLQTHQVPASPDGKTYLQTFTDRDVSSYAKIDHAILKDNFQNVQTEDKKFSVRENDPEMAVVFMQIKSEDYKDVFMNIGLAGATGGIAGFAIAPKATWTAASFTGKMLLRMPIVSVAGGLAGISYVAMNVHAGRIAAAGACASADSTAVSGDASAANGCSMVEILPYDAKAINEICEGIESLP